MKDKQKRVVLFVDGHSTHITDEVHEICKSNNIIYYILPSHSSHIIQPLDLCYYKNLKSRWREQIRAFKLKHKEMNIKKSQFILVFRDAWEAAYSSRLMKSSFRASGLYPYNPQAIDYKKCAPSALFGEPVKKGERAIIVNGFAAPSEQYQPPAAAPSDSNQSDQQYQPPPAAPSDSNQSDQQYQPPAAAAAAPQTTQSTEAMATTPRTSSPVRSSNFSIMYEWELSGVNIDPQVSHEQMSDLSAIEIDG